MDLKYHILLNITLLAAAVLNISCSTGRNTSASRAYHELTTRYNIYHNAEENYTRLLEAQLINSNDKWFELLTFHPGEKSTNKEIPGGPFDAVIDKTAKSIVEHSITAKPRRDPSKAHSTEYRQWLKQEEFNPYIKNSWLLMGKAYVQNGDYNEALSVFKEIQRIFPNEKELIAEAQIWMLRSYVGLNNKFEADNMIYILKSSKIPNDLEPLFNQEHTNYLLFNKQFAEALPYLQKTIDQEKRHLQKKRLQFLQGQIYMLLNKKELALKSFQKVKGIRTPPEVSRHASFYQATITNGEKQNSYFNDSIAQIINHNVSLEHIGSNLAHSVQATNKSDSSNFYIATPIVRVKANKYIGQEHLNKASSVTDLKESYSLLLFLEGNSNLLNQLLFATTNFNFSNFKLRTFKTTPIRISSKQAVKIEPFISLSETTRYLNQIKSDSTFRNEIPGIIFPLIAEEVKTDSILHYGKKEDLNESSYIYPIKLSLNPEKVNRENATTVKEAKEVEEVERVENEGPNHPVLQPTTPTKQPRINPSELKRRLEQNEAEAIRRSREANREDNREQLLRERARDREQRIKDREKEIRERERKREAELKQREREREQRIHEQQRNR